jgi:hypothetical protein
MLVFDIAGAMLGPSVILATRPVGGRIYCFQLSSSAGNRKGNEEQFYELIKTVEFKYKPADANKIEAARRKITSNTDIAQRLLCVRELALLGEYEASCDELSQLRSLIARNIPGPEVRGDIARNEAYGVLLKNPDSDRWKLSIVDEKMMLLEDRFSVSSGGIGVAAINAAKLLGDRTSEEQIKSFVRDFGRGSLMGIGGGIESERFRMFKGFLAYEGVSSTSIGGMKVKTIVFRGPGSLVMLLMMVDELNFKDRVAEYEALLDQCFHLDTTTPPPR